MQTSNKNNMRKAGSAQFEKNLNKAQDPFSVNANKVNNQQTSYDAAETRGYDDLNNNETYKALNQHNNLKEGGRFDYQNSARSGLKDSNFDFGGDLSTFNSEAAGSKNFDMQDVKYLRQNGASNEAINKYIGGLDNVHDSITTNQKYGGKHYRGDMDKSKGIDQYDMGKGFNKWDINYLKKQGFKDNEIADYGLASGEKHGSGTANFLNEMGRLDTRARNTFDPSAASATEPSKMQQKVDAAPIDVKHEYSAPDIQPQMDRVDEEINRDYWGETLKQTQQMIKESPNEHDSQKFLTKHLDMARTMRESQTGLDLSSKYNSGISLDINALDKQIRQTPLYWQGRSELQGLQTFGDKYRNSRENGPSWKNASPPAKFEPPDLKSLYNQTKNDINSINI